MNQLKCKEELGWETSKKQILFAANPDRPEKNFQLALDAYNTLQEKNVALKVLDNVPNDLMPVYFNAADVVVLTSLWEGSPNVIKEAMVCNIPIVSTNVGDVKEVIGKTKGCYISTFEPEDVAEKIQKALDFGKRTTGREDIKHLESGVIAKRIIEVYNKVLDKK
jgi:glycosyltransferase involved in cell wall biosynthesis